MTNIVQNHLTTFGTSQIQRREQHRLQRPQMFSLRTQPICIDAEQSNMWVGCWRRESRKKVYKSRASPQWPTLLSQPTRTQHCSFFLKTSEQLQDFPPAARTTPQFNLDLNTCTVFVWLALGCFPLPTDKLTLYKSGLNPLSHAGTCRCKIYSAHVNTAAGGQRSVRPKQAVWSDRKQQCCDVGLSLSWFRCRRDYRR